VVVELHATATGPVSDVRSDSSEYTPFDTSNRREVELRSSGRWIGSIERPTFVIEGTGGNHSSLQAMSKATTNPMVHSVTADGAEHFGGPAPKNALLARKILADRGATSRITLTDEEVSRLFAG
jgi:hypothetical protein